MIIIEKTKDLQIYRKTQTNTIIGFVPTMGTLHQGHLELIKRSKQETDFTYVSIFVNPLQFNNKSDFEKYPRNIEKDIQALKSINADVLFLPSFDEIYNVGIEYDTINLDYFNSILEGKTRPGHFEGVVKVVSILFKIILPHKAYFGLKDFQQVKVIEQLVNEKNYPIQIVPYPTIREPDGLAMSSRNLRLSENARKQAGKIYQWLLKARKMYKEGLSVNKIEQAIISEIAKHKEFTLDYFEIRDAENLSEITSSTQKPVAFIAVFLDEVRLIDNMEL